MSPKKRIIWHTLFFLTLSLLVGIRKQLIQWTNLFNFSDIGDYIISVAILLAVFFILAYIMFKVFEYNKLKFNMKINNAKTFLNVQKVIFNAFENIPIGIIILDPKGIIMYENKEVTKILGSPKFTGRNPLIGVDILKIDSLNSLNKIAYESLINCIKTKKPVYNIETPFTSIYGKTVDIQLSILPFTDENNTHLGFILVVQDITVKKLYVNRLIQKQKMETIGFLAAGVAHEYNNVLGIIQGYTDLLKEEIQNPELKTYMDSITNAINRAQKITTQLLGYSKEKSRRNMIKIKIKELIDEVVDMIKIELKNCKVNTYFENKDATIFGDRDALLQVFLNLTINSKKAMDNITEKEISLSVKLININKKELKNYPDAREGEFIKISFTDNGSGIPSENLSKIFDPFFSKKLSGTKGTGLGLYLVYTIIKNHNGFISVYSETNIGTTFNIYLPTYNGDDNEVIIENSTILNNNTPKNISILLIDDEDDLRNIFLNTLKKKDFKIDAAETGKHAVELLNKNKYDIIILDYTLSDTTGFELFYKIREKYPDTKIILMSGYGLNGKINTLMKDGLNKFIQKPFGIKKLLNTINEVINE